MRYNVFLLSATCFYFFMQTANLVLGAPADTGREPLTVDIAESDKSHTVIERITLGTKSLGKRDGQQTCALFTFKDGPYRRSYELDQAHCIDDLNYNGTCNKSTPPTDQISFDDMCEPDEICMEQIFLDPRTDVYCRKRMPTTIKFQGLNIGKVNCSPGVTAHDSRGTWVAFSAQFYSDDHYNNRARVSYSWIQTNKRAVMAENYDANGIYHQLDMAKDETAQACFVRQNNDEASFATLQWAED